MGPKRWLVEEARLAVPEASRYMRLVHRLPLHPRTEAAYDAAEITTGHVAAILTALATLPAGLRDTVEEHLVERSRFHPPEEIAGFVDELLDALGGTRQPMFAANAATLNAAWTSAAPCTAPGRSPAP